MGNSEGVSSVTANPSAYDLAANPSDQMVDDMIKAQSANATHYTEGWFYLPNRGWIWTNHSTYPYFYDAKDKEWMYFQSGKEKPKFYQYKKKNWINIEVTLEKLHPPLPLQRLPRAWHEVSLQNI